MNFSKQAAKASAGHHSASDSPSSLDDKSSHMEMTPNVGDVGPSDPKKLLRILANRESARRAYMRKLEYEAKLHQDAKEAEEKVARLSSQVAFYERKQGLLQMENIQIKERIKYLENYIAHKDGETLELSVERERLLLIREMQRGSGSGFPTINLDK
ncbi:hypothetical protein ACFX2I_009910 [Malus domestica]